MAQFLNDDALRDMIKSIEQYENNEEIYRRLISDGQQIMKDKIQSGASKHRSKLIRKHMADSIKVTKPTKDKNNCWVGRVKFVGTNGKIGNFDVTHWIKAFRIENGTSKQPAEPFVKPAIAASENLIRASWNKTFESELKKL